MFCIKITSFFFLSAFAVMGCKPNNPHIGGKIEIPPGLVAKLSEKAVLYVVARKAGQKEGPPVAVRRYPQPILFPVEFDLTAQDLMMPDQTLEGSYSITARISQSGSAMPIQAGDIEGIAQPDPAKVGQTDVRIMLDKIRD